VHGARLDMTEFMNWGGRVSCPTNSFFRVQLLIQGTNFRYKEKNKKEPSFKAKGKKRTVFITLNLSDAQSLVFVF
jgi:hypothetical protein